MNLVIVVVVASLMMRVGCRKMWTGGHDPIFSPSLTFNAFWRCFLAVDSSQLYNLNVQLVRMKKP